MRILFVLDRVENPASANAQLACRLAEELSQQGHTVHLLELWDGETAAAPAAQAAQPVQAAAPAVDTVAELQKYKMLVDTGVITEGEFAAKKKQLLGI